MKCLTDGNTDAKPSGEAVRPGILTRFRSAYFRLVNKEFCQGSWAKQAPGMVKELSHSPPSVNLGSYHTENIGVPMVAQQVKNPT